MPNFQCVCGKSFASGDNLRHHQRYRCRPDDQGNDDVCKICGRTFKSFAGVRQHMRRSHPEKYNDELQDEDRRVLRTWSAFENLQLARAEIAYTGYNINQHLHTLFPDRRTNVDTDEALTTILTPDIPTLDSGAPPDIPTTPEVFEIGPPDRVIDLSVSLDATGSQDVEHVPVLEQDVLPPPPSLPPTPSPPPTQQEAAVPDIDTVKLYIEHLLTLVVVNHEYRQNVDKVLDETVSIEERRGAMTFLWRNIGIRCLQNRSSAPK